MFWIIISNWIIYIKKILDIELNNVLLSAKIEARLCDFILAIENGIEGQKIIYVEIQIILHLNY